MKFAKWSLLAVFLLFALGPAFSAPPEIYPDPAQAHEPVAGVDAAVRHGGRRRRSGRRVGRAGRRRCKTGEGDGAERERGGCRD